jgi:N-acetylglucosaminyl-diphospho-decaprenol L-rhamnosyltransferase
MMEGTMPADDAEMEALVQATIVSYKTSSLVTDLLGSLSLERAAARKRGVEIRAVVVDNASGDADVLRRLVLESGWQAWVEIVQAPRNGGFAFGNNLGFQHGFASARRPDFFFLLNPDTQVRPGAVNTLVDFLNQHQRAGVVASGLEEQDGTLWPFAFRYPSLLGELDQGLRLGIVTKLLQHRIVLRPMGPEPAQVDWFPGASMVIRREVIEQVGGMDERYFLYYEETDFCRKVQHAGWELWYVPQSRVMHIAGESTGVTGRKRERRRLPDYWFESRRRYFLKNHGLPYAVATDVVFLVAHLIGQTKEALKRAGNLGTPHFALDILRHSPLRRANRTILPAEEFRPRQP